MCPSAEILAAVKAGIGQRAEAQAQHEELLLLARQRYVSSTLLSAIYLGLGEVDKAIEMVERAFEERDPVVLMLNVTPYADSLRGDPRYQDLLRRLRLAA
jgi:hypothetical protein